MKSAIFFHMITLLAVSASLELDIVIQAGLSDGTTVFGEAEKGGGRQSMTHSLYLTEPQCLDEASHQWQSSDCPDDLPKYLKVGQFYFQGSVREARPFTIKTLDYMVPVSPIHLCLGEHKSDSTVYCHHAGRTI